MEIRKIIQRKIERRERGLDLQASVNAVVTANVGEDGQTSSSSSRSSATARSDTRRREGEDPERTNRAP